MCFVCPRAAHIPPSQQLILVDCHAAAHTGDQSNISAVRHTQAPVFLPGAIGNRRDSLMWCRRNSTPAGATFARTFEDWPHRAPPIWLCHMSRWFLDLAGSPVAH